MTTTETKRLTLPKDFTAWEFGDWLTKATADYYLLADTYLEAEETIPRQAPEYAQRWRDHAGQMAPEIARYLVIACGGELRHNTRWKHSKGLVRHQMWEYVSYAMDGWFYTQIALTMDAWCKEFRGSGFGGSVGGIRWAQACAYVAEWLRGQSSDVMFVELTLNLHHNCAIIFNKLPLPKEFPRLLAVSDGITPKLQRLLAECSTEGRYEEWLRVRGHQEAVDSPTSPSRTTAESGSPTPPPTAKVKGALKVW